MGKKYSQHISSGVVPYPVWNPGEEACPLHPTNAVSLAVQAAAKAFPNVNGWEFSTLSLQTGMPGHNLDIWFYDVSLRPNVSSEEQERVTCASVIVGLDGHVPKIIVRGPTAKSQDDGVRKGTYAERLQQRREARRHPQQTAKPPLITGEQLEKQLQQYQMDLIRQGKPPMPIPLTPEMDKKLVEEGVLPPVEDDPVQDRDTQPDE